MCEKTSYYGVCPIVSRGDVKGDGSEAERAPWDAARRVGFILKLWAAPS